MNSIGQVFEGVLMASRYFQFIDLDPQSVAGTLTTAQSARPVPKPFARGLELRDVGFTYPGSERAVLEGLSFAIPVGAKVAIVGENGPERPPSSSSCPDSTTPRPVPCCWTERTCATTT
ncbi:MAG: hypothetical protein OXH09_07380 [Gammaproteobacteria bacterium]|nr:hypothetical protein [Gammaproteobacteria bacterium]